MSRAPLELGFGVWDNRLHAELEKETEQFDILWDETDKYVPPQGAEPLEDLMTRVHAMLQGAGGAPRRRTHSGDNARRRAAGGVYHCRAAGPCAICGRISLGIAAAWR